MDDDNKFANPKLENWVINKADEWRDHYEANYEQKFDEYYRLWRGIWAAEDKTRDSERSRLISPALQQAVESSVAEVEEATFGRGKWFDIRDDRNDKDPQDIAYLREQLTEDFHFTKTRKAVAECLLNSAVFGTGIGEIVIEEVKEMKPATQPLMDGAMEAVGVNIVDRVVVKLRPVLPQNFLIDPVATSIEDALGVVIDEFVPTHQVKLGIQNGIYRDVDIETAATDINLEADKELSTFDEDKVRLTKYYGLVPKHLFNEAMLDEEDDDEMSKTLTSDDDDEDEEEGYVEAIIVIANGGKLLKTTRGSRARWMPGTGRSSQRWTPGTRRRRLKW